MSTTATSHSQKRIGTLGRSCKKWSDDEDQLLPRGKMEGNSQEIQSSRFVVEPKEEEPKTYWSPSQKRRK